MFYGYIKKIDWDRGYGFIGQEGGRDVYFHASVVGDETFSRLQLDQPVMFEYAKRDPKEAISRGPRAGVIKLIARMPGGVLARPTQDLAPRHHPRARQRKATWRRGAGDIRRDEPPKQAGQPGN